MSKRSKKRAALHILAGAALLLGASWAMPRIINRLAEIMMDSTEVSYVDDWESNIITKKGDIYP